MSFEHDTEGSISSGAEEAFGVPGNFDVNEAFGRVADTPNDAFGKVITDPSSQGREAHDNSAKYIRPGNFLSKPLAVVAATGALAAAALYSVPRVDGWYHKAKSLVTHTDNSMTPDCEAEVRRISSDLVNGLTKHKPVKVDVRKVQSQYGRLAVYDKNDPDLEYHLEYDDPLLTDPVAINCDDDEVPEAYLGFSIYASNDGDLGGNHSSTPDLSGKPRRHIDTIILNAEDAIMKASPKGDPIITKKVKVHLPDRHVVTDESMGLFDQDGYEYAVYLSETW